MNTNNKILSGVKIAILVANGFDEADMTESQRALLSAGAAPKVVSVDQGLVNGWQGRGWGHHFAVDLPLSTSLAADFAMLVIPGGARSLDKLKMTAHTRRFIGGFMAAGKPVAVFGDAVRLLAFAEQLGGRTVTGAAESREEAERAGAIWSEETMALDGALLTGVSGNETRESLIRAMIDHFAQGSSVKKAA